VLIKALAGNRAAVAPADQDIQVTAVDPHRAEQHHAVAAVRFRVPALDHTCQRFRPHLMLIPDEEYLMPSSIAGR